jgi:hypothetical protein
MDNIKMDASVLKAYITQVKKLFTNFNEGILSAYIPSIKEIICDERGAPVLDKFSPDDEYKNLLDAYCVIMALKRSNDAYNSLFKMYNETKPVVKETAPIIKKKPVKIPTGWRVIQGGKSKTV